MSDVDELQTEAFDETHSRTYDFPAESTPSRVNRRVEITESPIAACCEVQLPLKASGCLLFVPDKVCRSTRIFQYLFSCLVSSIVGSLSFTFFFTPLWPACSSRSIALLLCVGTTSLQLSSTRTSSSRYVSMHSPEERSMLLMCLPDLMKAIVSVYLASSDASIFIRDESKLRRQRSRCSGSKFKSQGPNTGARDSALAMW